MKCDELKARTIYVDCMGRTIVYFDPYEVNDAITELKAKIAELQQEIKYKEGVSKRWFDRCMKARAILNRELNFTNNFQK